MKTALPLNKYGLLINGTVVPSSQDRYFDAVNPSTGEVIAHIADASVEDVVCAVLQARQAFDESIGCQGHISAAARGEQLIKVAELIREHAKELAELECLNTGKTLKQTTFIDIPTAADTFEYFGKNRDMLKSETVNHTMPAFSLTEREPMGVVAAIIPWNYPLIMAAWKIAPALLCGNSVILKPSKLAALSLVRLGQLIAAAGLFKESLSILTSSDAAAASVLAEHPDVDMVSFSGGTKTGQEIMRLASKTTKKVVLELGGKSPNIVFADCDQEAALGGSLSAIFMNQGQMCTAGSRLLVEDKIYDEFVGKLVERAKTFKIGNAINFDTEFGPVISREHRDKILSAIEQGKIEGAKLLCGGKIPAGIDANGFYVEPTVFGDVKNSMTIAQEEIFGPVLSVIRFKDEADAVKIANDTRYGLAAMIWSKDLARANRVARQLRCGTVWINTYGSFPNEAPFGGYKQSGFGRELGPEGVLEYTQTKNICTDQTPGGKPLVSAWF
jgi:acyl-CoA reductase-like NAD-dependent aldehyde dehydrogenase